MSVVDRQYAAVAAFLDELVQGGVQHVCVCPGARSTPLAIGAARHPGLRVWSHVDERSAAFFGLGIAKSSGRPAALVCTSGTAAANFFPAVIEAAYAHVPLVVVTADRPAELRDCGAAQTIDHNRLYGTHVKWFVEAGPPELDERYFRSLAVRATAAACTLPAGPVHVNFAFREPLMPREDAPSSLRLLSAAAQTLVPAPVLLPSPDTVERLISRVSAAQRGLIVCGPLDWGHRHAEAIAALSAHLRYPILADPLSQLRAGPHAGGLVLASYDALLRDEGFARRMTPELILRVGPLPTSKAFLQYARDGGCEHVVVDPLGAWNDPALIATEIVRADPSATCRALIEASPRRAQSIWNETWTSADRRAAHAIAERLDRLAELFDGKVFTEIAPLLPERSSVFVGNSMPVRDLESFWPVSEKSVRFLCNRGVNGIDGFVSSGLGAAAVSDGPVVMITGDLGLYHDLNGLLAVKRHGLRATLIVLNNDGGGIFSFLPQGECEPGLEELFSTPHGLNFRGAVEMYGAAFVRVASWEQFRNAFQESLAAPCTTVIEVPTERRRNVELHREIWRAVRDAM